MAGSLSDSSLSQFSKLELIAEDCFGEVYGGTRKTDNQKVMVRLLKSPIDIENIQTIINQADKEDFLTDIEVINSTIIVTLTDDYDRLSDLNKLDLSHTLPVSEFEALGIIGAVLPKLIKADRSELYVFNVRPSNLYVKRVVQGKPQEKESSHVLRIGEPYQHLLYKNSAEVNDRYAPQNYLHNKDNNLSHSLGCLMHHLAFGEPVGETQRENNMLSYLYSHYMFQLTKANPRERLNLIGFEKSSRTLKDCEALVIYPTTKVTNMLTVRGFYTGDMRYGQMHGEGYFSAHKEAIGGLDVSACRGTFCLDKLHSKGIIFYRSGDRYEGSVQWDAPRGEGVMTRLSGTRLTGEWEGTSLVEDSEAEIIIPDYSNYRGRVSKSQPHGEGVMVYNDGLVYKGEFKHNQRHGQGEMFRKVADVFEYRYVGGWYENEKHGDGVETNEVNCYKGSFHMGKKHGNGKLVNNEGNWTYEGEFKNDNFSGLGMLSAESGERYNGEFKLGKKHGYGCSESQDGSVYDGQWENDKYHGDGSMTDADGNTIHGVWLNGEQVEYDE